jgi:hypothetical protein
MASVLPFTCKSANQQKKNGRWHKADAGNPVTISKDFKKIKGNFFVFIAKEY